MFLFLRLTVLFVYVCVCVFMCMHMFGGCLWRPEKGVGSLAAGVTRECEAPSVSTKHRPLVLCEKSKYS